MAANTVTRQKRSSPNTGAPQGVIDFTAAAHEHVEPGGFDVSLLLTTNSVVLGPFDVPAYGFIRHLAIQVSTTTAAVGAATASADYPFNIFGEVSFLDVNGAYLVGPMNGYDLYLCNVFGGYAFKQDIRSQPAFSAAVLTPAFIIRIPIEIHHSTGLGALANQNSAASYKVRLTVNGTATIYTSAPATSQATIRIRGWLEAWTQPAPQSLSGVPQAVVPPRHGTTQYWTKYTKTGLSVGDNVILFPRVGNLIRGLVLVFRDGTGVRSAVVPPDPLELRWDARQLILEPQALRTCYMAERNLLAGAPDAGVFAYQFNNDVLGHGGDGTPELWLPTVQSTRLEFRGVNIGAAGSVDIFTNDVAPVEIQPAGRYVEQSSSGFSPQGGVPVSA